MNYPVSTALQLRAVLRGMRKARGLSQAQVGLLLGVNQKRAARIEGAPGLTAFDQIARLVAALGGRVVEMRDPAPSTVTGTVLRGGTRKAAAPAAGKNQGTW